MQLTGLQLAVTAGAKTAGAKNVRKAIASSHQPRNGQYKAQIIQGRVKAVLRKASGDSLSPHDWSNEQSTKG